MALRPRFDAALRQAIAEKAENEGSEAVPDDSEDNGGEDEDTTKAMARLFAELGEAYVELVASGSQEAVIMAQAMLEVRSAFSCGRERGGACERGRGGSYQYRGEIVLLVCTAEPLTWSCRHRSLREEGASLASQCNP